MLADAPLPPEWVRWRGPHTKHHRGAAILTMGLLSLVGAAFCGFPGLAVGTAAWSMGTQDLRDMQQGLMDADGEAMTHVGRTCGMVGALLGLVIALGLCLYFWLRSSLLEG
jgi:hypothetical protein